LRPSDIDLVEIHGYGFPRWRGGLMHHAQSQGLDRIVAALGAFAEKGLADPPSTLLVRAAAQGRFSEALR
ncbi:hypothetical protein BMJ22_19870, partial [Sinorhizobium medicae]